MAVTTKDDSSGGPTGPGSSGSADRFGDADTSDGSSSAPQTSGRPSFGLVRRSKARLCLAASVVLGTYIVVMINGIAFRHPGRFDLTEEKIHSLSDETRATLGLVGEKVQVILPLYVEQGNSRYKTDYRVLMRAKELLRIYSLEQPLMQPVQVVDVHAEASRWQSLCNEYELKPTQFNRLLFFAGEGGPHREMLMPKDIAVLIPSPSPNEPPIIKSFHGEAALTASISRLVHRHRKKVYFSTGHGELVPGKSSRMGSFVHTLRSSGFDIGVISLARVRRVHDDCDLLVIARAENAFSEDELDVIEEFLDRDGRLLVALGSSRTNLEPLLAIWGIEVLAGHVQWRSTGISTRLETSWVLAPSFHRAHSITAPFDTAASYEVHFFEPRPLKAVGASRRLESTALLSTGGSDASHKCYLVGGLGSGRVGGEDDEYVLAATTRQENIENPPESWVELKTRLVVFGASNILSDESRGGFDGVSHREFVMNSVNWLVDREELIVAEGVGEVERRLKMSDDSLRGFLFYSSLMIFPGIFLCLGVFVYFLRRA
jgi:hypothetical protein